jgi:hypothetical protein
MPMSGRGARVFLVLVVVVIMFGLAGCNTPPPLNPQTLLPTDACASNTCMPPSPIPGFSDVCTITSSQFAGWFQPIPPATTGVVTLNGVVNPADSVNFPNTPNCSFYQWAMQDFLWLTSPAPPTYGGGGGRILDSPAFYDVTPPAADGSRTLLPHSAGFIHPMALRAAQPASLGLQLIFDTAGTPIQVKPAEKGAIPVVLTPAGQRIQVVHARLGPNNKPVLLDKSGNEILALRSRGGIPQLQNKKNAARIPTMLVAQKFMVDRLPIFIDPSLSVIDVEGGEAITNGVLEAQTSAGGSLVYYASIVNDVYAYYATGVLDGAISLAGDGICTPLPPPPSPQGTPCFPTTAGQLAQITSFASAHGKTFPDPNALAVEIKSAWVVAAGLPNLSSYITMNATIPTYSPAPPPPANTATITATGQQTVQLALVGIHVVGSVAGHPEMIWATFEHRDNAPAATYSYINTSGATATVNQNPTVVPTIGGHLAPWVFSSTSATNFNNQNMTYQDFPAPATITATATPPGITPSDTMRWKPFGGATDVSPNPVDPSTAVSNTEIIALDNAVLSLLAPGDVRGNYIMTGATWTIGGAPPDPNVGGNQVGTSSLANTTMETYVQGLLPNPTNQAGGTNCLTCHVTNLTSVSHIFPALKPLF